MTPDDDPLPFASRPMFSLVERVLLGALIAVGLVCLALGWQIARPEQPAGQTVSACTFTPTETRP